MVIHPGGMRNMNRERTSGILLIAGALAGVVVMALHPTAHGVMAPGSGASVGHLNRMVHGLAIAAAPVVFFGLVGLGRRLGPGDLTTAALVACGFGATAILGAAIASGFVATEVIEWVRDGEGLARENGHLLLDYTSLWNQAFAKVYAAAMSAGILLWSAAIVSTGRMARSIGYAGIAIGAAALLGILSGHVRMSIHGFGAIVVLHAVWMVAVGIALISVSSGTRPA